jgi:serine/threonine-protein kinase
MGGMGEVVLAERADQQFKQLVAIKLVKRGLASKHVRGRLKVERQILASLNHPNIAKLLDGGVTADGTPYIVMEYVEGEPIDFYCDRHRLSIRQRVQLMQKVLSAVHSAHRNLVVHRDLKPSNILVTADGVPKLLDFGIAKLLDQRESLHTVAMTQMDMRLMTPDHASPEQVMGLPITTSSDIYVLGVLLYELLTGYRPFDLQNKPLSGIERVICEEVPIAPSAIVAAAKEKDGGSEAISLAERRSTSVTRWVRDLRGDLDNIVLLAMRKEPERRYASVEQFAADLERHLEGAPVIARGDSWRYRSAKFVRRHASAVALSAALLASLLGFAVTTAIQARRLEHERDAVAAQHARAEAERDRAESVSAFLMSAFQVSDPSENRGNEIKAREILDQGARKIDAELHSQPAMQAVMLDTIGRVYFNMGLLAESEPLLEQALDIRTSLLGAEHPDVGASLVSLAQLRREQGRYDVARSMLLRARNISTASFGPASRQVAGDEHELGRLYYASGQFNEAEASLRKALDMFRRSGARDTAATTRVMDDLAVVLQAKGEFAQAERLYREALDKDRITLGEDHPQYAIHLVNLAAATHAQGRLDEAEKLFGDAIQKLEYSLGDKHPETIDALSNLGALLQERKDLDGAEKAFMKALELDKQLRGPTHNYVGMDLMQLGSLAIARGRFQDSEKFMRESLSIFRSTLPENHPYIATGVANLGRTLLELNRWDEAETTLREAIKLETEALGADSEEVAVAGVSLARVLAAKKRFDDAEPLFHRGYETLLRTRGPSGNRTLQTRQWINEFYARRGRPADADAYFAKASPTQR